MAQHLSVLLIPFWALLSPLDASEPVFSFTFRVGGMDCPATITGAPGSTFEAEVVVVLSQEGGGPGIDDWSLAIEGENVRVIPATFEDLYGMDCCDVIDPAYHDEEELVLCGCMRFKGRPRVPEGPGTYPVERFRIEATFPEFGSLPARLVFLDEALVTYAPSIHMGVIYRSRSVTASSGRLVLGECAFDLAARTARFLRGDSNGDGVLEPLSDAVFLLRYLFAGEGKPPCLEACDADGDDRVVGQVTDPVYLLDHGFQGGPAPPPPFPGCGRAELPAYGLDCVDPPDCR